MAPRKNNGKGKASPKKAVQRNEVPKEPKPLTVKQEAFCQAYVENGGNASDAYRSAYDCSRSTDKSIWELASQLLSGVKVASRVKELRASILKRHQVTVDRVIQEYSKLAFANMLDYVALTSDGLAKVDFSSLTREQAAAIQEIKVDRLVQSAGAGEEDKPPQIEKVTFKLSDKKGALDSLGKYLGMFIERSEVGKPGDFARMSDEQVDEFIAEAVRELSAKKTREDDRVIN